MPSIEEGHLDRAALAALQRDRLDKLLTEILPRNHFYTDKFARAGLSAADMRSPVDLKILPFTTKAELLADQAAHPPFGRNQTYPLANYRRYHQTSGTTGRPLRWLDTAESWAWVVGCWSKIYAITGVAPEDRLFFPFSFGPFLGFWSAFEAADRLGCLCLPGGGMSSGARLRFLLDNEATVVLCTPTYALYLAETARQQGIDLCGSPVRALIVAGEPGGSIPATRARLEQSWGARVFDHSGMTEVGPIAVECSPAPGGLHVLEGDYLVEVIDSATGEEVAPGKPGELVVTNLGRGACPLIRYRTGDLVRVAERPCPCGLNFLRLEGGILGRSDELIHIRGNNVYPTALEAIVRGFVEVVEYRIEVDNSGDLAELRVEIEPAAAETGPDLARRIQQAIRDLLLFRAEVVAVPPGSLPRYELKARRIMMKDAR